MDEPIQVLIVEDETLVANCISLQLSKAGYKVSAIISTGEDALKHVKENQPDIVLMDIQLEGEMDGIETARQMHDKFNIPIIYLTAFTDDVNFSRAKATKPCAFISKPFKSIDLQRAIDLAANRLMISKSSENARTENGESPFILRDCIFVKDYEKMVKIAISDILHIEAERNYCRIYLKNKEYLLVMTLKELDKKLPQKHFLRIHRSHVINISKIKEIGTGHVVVGRKTIPLSKSLKEGLLKRLQTI